jgi:hypothetical protein
MWVPLPPRVADKWATRHALHRPCHLSILLTVSLFDQSPHELTPPLPSLRPRHFPLSSRHPRSRNAAAAGGCRHQFRFPLVPPSSRPSFMQVGLVLLRPPGPHLPRSLWLGFLLFVFFSFFLFLFLFFFFLFSIFCCRLIDSLLQNPRLMPDLFDEGRRFSCASTVAFVRSMFFLCPFLLQVPFLPPVPCVVFLSFTFRLFFLVPASHHPVLLRTLHLGLSLYVSFLFFPLSL